MSNDVKRILPVVFLLLLFGGVLVLAAKAIINMQTEVLLVGIFFAPLVGFLALRYGIREIAIGAGGLTAKFGEVAKDAVQPDHMPPIGPTLSHLQEVGEKGFAALEGMLASYNLSEFHPIVMLIKLGRGDYPREDTLGFIEKLSLYRSFKFVIFVDEKERLFAYMPSWAIRQLLSRPELGDVFLSIINRDGNFSELLQYPNVITDTVNEKDTNATALQQMANLGSDAIVVVDTDRRLKGVVERDNIVNQMILASIKK